MPARGTSILYGKRFAASAANSVLVFCSDLSEFGNNCGRPAQPASRLATSTSRPISETVRANEPREANGEVMANTIRLTEPYDTSAGTAQIPQPCSVIGRAATGT